MFSAKKITADEAEEHSLTIDDFVSKPVNPAQLLESIEKIFERRKDVAMEMLLAKDAGLSPEILQEYSALRKNIEVDKNLLTVLRASTGMDVPGKEVAGVRPRRYHKTRRKSQFERGTVKSDQRPVHEQSLNQPVVLSEIILFIERMFIYFSCIVLMLYVLPWGFVARVR